MLSYKPLGFKTNTSPLAFQSGGFLLVKMCKDVVGGLISVIINMDPIHPKLEEQILIICEAAAECGSPVDYHATKNESAALLYNKESVALITIKEHSDHYLAQPYIVDINKWAWAEEEGFSREEIWSKGKLQEMIFLPTTKKKLYKHLKISSV